MCRVEEGNHQNTAYVVDNRQRSEEYFQSNGYPLAQHRQYTQRKGYIGSHRYGTAPQEIAPPPYIHEEQHRHHHAADSCDNGQQGLLQRGQLAHQYLAFDFEADGEKEDGHERIVNECHDRHRFTTVTEEVEPAHLKGYGLCPPRKIEIGER